MQTTTPCNPATPTSQVQIHFLAVLPRISLHARVYFRDLRCPDRQEEAVAEAEALAWAWFARLVQRGKDPAAFVSVLAAHAARHVRSGRRLCGQEKSQDALSPLAQARHGFTVSSLPDGSSLHGSVFDDALRDNTQTPPEDQAAFRIDSPAWRRTHCVRDRRLIDRLMAGERTVEAGRAFGLSPARASQKRREFRDGWLAYCGQAGQ